MPEGDTKISKKKFTKPIVGELEDENEGEIDSERSLLK